MPGETKTARLPPSDQPAGCLYEMSLRFVYDASLREVDDMLDFCGVPERPVLKDAGILHMEQIVPFIPDDGAIRRYVEIIAENLRKGNGGIAVRHLRFDGYDYIYAVAPEKQEHAKGESRNGLPLS